MASASADNSTPSIRDNYTAADVLIVVVNYFMAQDCIHLFEYIEQLNCHRVKRIVCVDNSCDQEQAKLLSTLSQSSQVSLLINSENKGFGRAINAAVEEQFRLDEQLQFALLINPDVALNADTLDALFAGQELTPEAGVWGGVTVNQYGDADGFHAWREPSVLRELAWSIGLSKLMPNSAFTSSYADYHAKKVRQQQNEAALVEQSELALNNQSGYAVDCVSGCFFLIDRQTWQGTGGFDERFFLYSEEIDLCTRARQLGARPQVIMQATLIHQRGAASASDARMQMLFHSKLLYWRKHGNSVNYYAVRVGYLLAALIRCGTAWVRPKRQTDAKVWWQLAVSILTARI